MENSLPTQPNSPIPTPPVPISPGPFWKNPLFLLIILAVLLILAGGFYLYSQNSKPTAPASTGTQKPANAIAKVGEEYIYQNDLDMELKFNPVSSNSAQLKKQLLNKLADDSIIIQGSLADKIATADASLYNSPAKDQMKRYKLISQIKKSVEGQADTISGFKVAIWFLNVHVGPLGYDRAKEIALEKITKLHDDVVSKKITIQQAIETIKNDSSLAQLDPKSYKSNAGGKFEAARDQKITVTTAFNDALWNTPVGGVTDIITGASDDQDNGGKIVDAYFTFGTVTSKTQNGKIAGFEDWLAQKRKLYEVKIY